MPRPQVVTTWNARYFEGQLPEAFLDILAGLPTERQDVVEFVDRLFGLMHQGRFRATDIPRTLANPASAGLFARILPGEWSGRIPPITVSGRHARIDDYVLNNRWRPSEAGVYLDIGCGFPPLTALDTAEALEDWHVKAIDPSLPSCVVYDRDQNYATFDADGKITYYQPSAPTFADWKKLVDDRNATETRFRSLRDGLLPFLSDRAEAESDGARIINPVRLYSRENLSLQAAGIGDADVSDVDVCRCFNVLFYFDAAFRKSALEWFSTILRDGGLLLVGADWTDTTEVRYSVYQKVNGRLVTREFAFSIDNLCSLTLCPWFALTDDDHETLRLSELSRELRSDERFLHRLYEVSDALRAEYDLCPRKPDGYYGDIDPSVGHVELWDRARAISRSLDAELASAAVDTLQAAGREAWINDVGHVAVTPPDGVV